MANFNKVFKVFKDNYQLVPLEVFTDPYKILISTLLSSRTKDETTLIASNKLFQKANTIKKLNRLSQQEIEKLIFPVGFYKTKAKYLKVLSKIIINHYSCDIPKTKEELMSLPGVGRKTANLVLNRAYAIPAIAVDTHVHRIVNTLNWVKTKNPQQTENELVKILPQKYWRDTNRLFVSIGRQYKTTKKLKEFLLEQKIL